MKKANLRSALIVFICVLLLAGCGSKGSSKGYNFSDFALVDMTEASIEKMFGDSSVYEYEQTEPLSKYEIYQYRYTILDEDYYINAFGEQFSRFWMSHSDINGLHLYTLNMTKDISSCSDTEVEQMIKNMKGALSKWGETAEPRHEALLCYEKTMTGGKIAHVEVSTLFGYILLSESINVKS